MRRSVRILSFVTAIAVPGMLAGCYERVVRAEGPTAYKYDVHESNLKHDGWANELADDLFGSDESKDQMLKD